MNQPSPQNAAAQNFAARQALIATGLHMTKKLQPVTAGNLGGSVRVPLDRMGVVTGVTLLIGVPVTITAIAAASDFGPYSFLNSIRYTDFAGVERVNTNGYMLHALNSLKMHRVWGNAVDYAFLTGSEFAIDTNQLKVPTAVASDTMYFAVHVPLAYDAGSDLRGAVLAQTIYGDHYITLTLPDALVGSDGLAYPYKSGTMTLNGDITIEAYQHYIMPQNGVANLPQIDLSTIYALEGNYNDSANIVAGQSKYISWPNNRSILSAMHIFDNGGAGVLNGADLSGITLVGNSNTHLRELTPRLLRMQMRMMLQTDLANGTYLLSSRTQPVTTQLYGNVQTKMDVVTANAGAYFLSQYESTYLSGTPLPGVIQG